MITVGAYEAKTHLSALLLKVEQGESVTITRHDVPIAILEPVSRRGRMSVAQAIERLKELRQGKSLGGITFRELIEEGRRS